MEQWEYKTILCGYKLECDFTNVEQVLNNLGKEGWELVGTMCSSSGDGHIFLKRRKQG